MINYTRQCGSFARVDVSRRGMSLIELVVTITLIASMAALIIPATNGDNLLKAKAVANVLRSDIELAQVLTMTDPANPVVLQFDPTGTAYWLAESSAPHIPIKLDNRGELYMMTIGMGRLATGHGVTIDAGALPDGQLAFDMNGAVWPPMSTPVIMLNAGDAWVQLEIAPMTGTVTDTTSYSTNQ